MHELIKAGTSHIDDLVELICTTGPYRTAVTNNQLGLSYRDFLVRFLVMPRLDHAYVLVDRSSDDRVIGALICAPLHDLAPTDWSQCSSENIEALHAPFKTLHIPECFYIDVLAVVPDMQGRGLGKLLFSAAESMANNLGYKDNLSLVVCANDVKAIRLYYTMEMIVSDSVQVGFSQFPPFLLMRKASHYLSYEKLIM